MNSPTGSLTVVGDYIEEALQCEARAELLIENECWNTAIEQALQAEKLRKQAGLECLLWMLAVLQMVAEPNPWKEQQAKLAPEQVSE